jgi:Icc-related predicted phosphoesterase
MRLVALSDTHNRCEDVAVPDGDLLIHAGDLTARGSLEEIARAHDWLASMPHRHKVVIAGNHDFGFEQTPEQARELMRGVIYLEDTSTTIDGLVIYGSPWTPWFHGWAFNRRRGAEMERTWAKIDPQAHILVTHGPARDVLDRTFLGVHAGCEALALAVARLQPRLHIFGHIHEGHGTQQIGATQCINASLCDLRYRPAHAPVVVDL